MSLAIFQSAQEWSAQCGAKESSVLSVGNFDGIHLGHQEILRLVLARARATARRAVVVTFDPHPLKVLRPNQAPRMIQTLAQRLTVIGQMGLDAAVVLRFDRALSVLSPEEFIENILVGGLRVGTILVGANFCFGYRGAGNVRLLQEFGRLHDYVVEIVPPVEIAGQIVSSTAVRNAIANGNVTSAIPLLGHPFSLTGEICPGAGRGRTILFPTLNFAPEQELLPKLGVYATESVAGENVYRSVTNVGTRPTFDGNGVIVESHLFGFDEQITSGHMEVRFHERIRDEQKFHSVDQLHAQIAHDIIAAKEFFSARSIPEHSPRGR